MSDEKRIVTARWLFPVTGPPIEHGILVLDGERIAAVEPRGSRCVDHDFGEALASLAR